MNLINLIPMAGEGKRFKEEGYSTPKPLIDINGKPMVIRAIECLPKAIKNILIVRKDVIDINEFRKILDCYFDNIEILEIDFLTEGQAATCLLAEHLVPSNSILNIGACDIGLEYDIYSYNSHLNEFDSFIWVYNNNFNVLNNPNMYGWVETHDNSDLIKKVSCKKPISENLLEDLVVSGTFTFKNSNDFFNSVRKMIESDDRINNEFYLDNIFNHYNLSMGIFKVKNYNSWGTPAELKKYLHGI